MLTLFGLDLLGALCRSFLIVLLLLFRDPHLQISGSARGARIFIINRWEITLR